MTAKRRTNPLPTSNKASRSSTKKSGKSNRTLSFRLEVKPSGQLRIDEVLIHGGDQSFPRRLERSSRHTTRRTSFVNTEIVRYLNLTCEELSERARTLTLTFPSSPSKSTRLFVKFWISSKLPHGVLLWTLRHQLALFAASVLRTGRDMQFVYHSLLIRVPLMS